MTKKHKIMILGAAGQVGRCLQEAVLPADWELGLFSRREVDLTQASALRDAFQTFHPDLVINAAAYTAVDAAEKDELAATAINFHAAANLAAHCSRHDVPMIQLSTDYVFDGRLDRPYREDDKMNPLSVYGATKLMGEEAVRHELAWHVVLRIASVFSSVGRNILTNTIRFIDERDSLLMVTDQLGCPTSAHEVARAVIAIGAAILHGKVDGFGTFHFCGMPPCTRYAWAQAVMAAYGSYTSRRPDIAPTTSETFAHLAKRPPYAVLDCAKIARVYGVSQPCWQDDLVAAVARFVHERAEAVSA